MEDSITKSRRTIRATLLRTIDTLHRVIHENRRLAALPGHEATAGQRVREGEAELARAEEELARLDAGGSPSTPEPLQ